ncbi:histidine kinase N-terminal 7TM domain-containing protein [Haloarchaeobius sp. TZWWS8]|uniref:sensor histidine kinase n=1 Tax=Haloarchaeobius sp. TZWWS8 TaxID=3446121 RepID=UPI003EBC8FCD
MGLQWTPLTIPLVLGAGVQAVVAGYLVARREAFDRIPGARAAVALLFAVCLLMLAYAAELSVGGDDPTRVLNAKLFWNMVHYIGMAAVPGLWFLYVVQFTRYDDVPRVAWVPIAAGGVLTPVTVFTNHWHGMFWTEISLANRTTRQFLVNEHGVAFFVFTAYAYVLVIAATALLIREYVDSSGLYRRQLLGLLVGSLAPLVASAIYLLGPESVQVYNLTAFAFAITAAAVGWSVSRNRLFQLTPVARRTAFEQMADPAVVLDRHKRVLDTNPPATVLFESDPVGASVDSVATVPFDGDDETITVEAGGETLHYERTRTELVDRGESIGWLVLFRDVTDRVRRERELRRQNERLDQFASVVSHDLRNPLGIAEGYLDLYRETGDESHFGRIDRAHDRMGEIVDDLLTLARDGGSVGETEPIDLATVAEHAWESVDSEGSRLAVERTATIEADRGRLLRLFENLFRNSVEHGVRPSSTTARTAQSATVVEEDPLTVTVGSLPTGEGFYVEDDGVGLPGSLREQVFESGVTGSEDGTGLGLAIVASIADAHDWTVRVAESRSGGARFEVRTDAALDVPSVR